jgi:hypothetical protein
MTNGVSIHLNVSYFVLFLSCFLFIQIPPDRTIYSSVACTLARGRQLPALKRLLSELVKRVGTLGLHASNYKARVGADKQVHTPAALSLSGDQSLGSTELVAFEVAEKEEGEEKEGYRSVDSDETDDAVSSDKSWLEWLGGTLLDILVRY